MRDTPQPAEARVAGQPPRRGQRFGAEQGGRIFRRMMSDYITRYLATLKWLGVERRTLFPEELSAYLKAS